MIHNCFIKPPPLCFVLPPPPKEVEKEATGDHEVYPPPPLPAPARDVLVTVVCGIPPVWTRFGELLAVLAKRPPNKTTAKFPMCRTQRNPVMCFVSY